MHTSLVGFCNNFNVLHRSFHHFVCKHSRDINLPTVRKTQKVMINTKIIKNRHQTQWVAIIKNSTASDPFEIWNMFLNGNLSNPVGLILLQQTEN